MEKCNIVLVDMDGVLVDFDGEVLRRMKTEFPYIKQLEEREKFYVSDDYPEHSELVRYISDQPGFFEALPLLDNAIEGWQRMVDLGYDPRICSSPMRSNPYCTSEKLVSIRKHLVPIFGELALVNAIISREKAEHNGIALIDDKPEIVNIEKASFTHIVFDQPYNRHVTNPRIKGWLDDNLERHLEQASRDYHNKITN
ncbi:MAG: hypothetical protein WCQ49_01425 [Candidatus Saccharibacteria bacterium]